MVSTLKGLGYFVSTFSVLLLGIVAWKGAEEEPLLFACLISGMAASVVGMGLRFISHRLGEKEKKAIGAKADQAMDGSDCGAASGSIRAVEPKKEEVRDRTEHRHRRREPARGLAEP